ncbi:hypothetical protein [Pseudanabaena sp. FACHB-2040]|uniref:hypothetical protein n=1 Tax=Pseudanabaena sp. FACHB-2040 TaxID=2692859 RepID=UPI001685B40E|nr:hypothetical protein [Pseudanabaena sp. FACHB-2040]MBD2258029.1 hypothetical protein [Pseudanabaena sp. FACHB-2040]
MEMSWPILSWKTLARWSSLAGIVFGLAGCEQLPSLMPSLKEVDLSLQVEPAEQPGEFAIAGQTNLPNGTQMVVLAVRQLQPSQPVAAASAAQPTYAILAYQPVQVTAGQWQANLNLWQVSPEGAYREPWQLEATKLNLAVEPAPEVQFIVTLAPQGLLASLEDQLKQQGLRLPQPLLRITQQGDRFLQTEQVRLVTLPTGSTTPPGVRPEDVNGGWGERYRLVPEPPLPYTLDPEDERKTDAPAAIEEYLF